MIDPGLTGKVALVTGGNNPYGIGAAIAREFSSHGAKVFIHDFARRLIFPLIAEKRNQDWLSFSNNKERLPMKWQNLSGKPVGKSGIGKGILRILRT